MLKVLIVAAIFSITFDMILADDSHRAYAWIEGFAILVAVATVATVGSFVDWRKEVQFVKSRAKSDEKNVCRVLRNGELSRFTTTSSMSATLSTLSLVWLTRSTALSSRLLSCAPTRLP